MGALMQWLNSRPFEVPAQAPELRSVEELRLRSLEALADCNRPNDDRIRGQVTRAATPQQLWLMRCDIYQAIARQHCEAEAVRRMNALLPAFEGWLPPGALKRL